MKIKHFFMARFYIFRVPRGKSIVKINIFQKKLFIDKNKMQFTVEII